MAPMTSYERFSRMYAHKEADRVPITDIPWGATIERWEREGMPKGMSFVDFFGLDQVCGLWADISPRYETKVIEETDEYIIQTTGWGATLRNWKHAASTPEFLDFTIKDRDSWASAKARMSPSPDRVDWKNLERNYPQWRKNGAWIEGNLWFGFDVTHSWSTGTERILIAMLEDPGWVMDMFSHYLECGIAMLDMIWDRGYHFDCVSWPDDMGYKGTPFFSLETYREVLKPFQKRACDWAHSKGIPTHLHSCGNIMPFIPDLVEIGIDSLNPLEVKAGMDSFKIKREYGDKLVLHGGVNAVLWDKPDEIRAEMERVVPVLKEGGGYIFSSDHSVPSSVSLEDFRSIIELAKKLGSYA